jgi:uncharacterized membrane protein
VVIPELYRKHSRPPNAVRATHGQVIASRLSPRARTAQSGAINTEGTAMNTVNLPVLGSTALTEVHMRAFDSIIITHAVTASFAILLGAVVLLMRKGSQTHKALGRVWALSMLITGLSAVFIPAHVFPLIKIGPLVWGPIHILILTSLSSLARAIYYAKQGNIRAHRGNMIGSYSGLVIAGAFTFTPGRMLHAWGNTVVEFMAAKLKLTGMILINTPFWVWIGLAALVVYGLSQRAPKTMSAQRAVIAPVILLLLALQSSLSLLGVSASLLMVIPVAVALGTLVPVNTRWSLTEPALQTPLDTPIQSPIQLLRAGGYATLGWVLVVFSLKYTLAVRQAMGLQLNIAFWGTVFGVLAAFQVRNLRSILKLVGWRAVFLRHGDGKMIQAQPRG